MTKITTNDLLNSICRVCWRDLYAVHPGANVDTLTIRCVHCGDEIALPTLLVTRCAARYAATHGGGPLLRRPDCRPT